MSQFLGTDDGWHRIVGTPYHHEGLLMYLVGKQIEGKPLYLLRKKPGTIGGEPNGEPAYWSQRKLAEVRASLSKREFNSQVLLNPTPIGTLTLTPTFLQEVEPQAIPKNLFKFMTVDPAGVNKVARLADSWAILTLGVEPYRDDLGASNVYILDAVCEPLSEAEALEAIVNMYTRNGRILKLGVEKVGMMSAEVHVANALRARGKSVTLEGGNLVLLKPAGRSKQERIEKNLQWPLNNGKIFISKGVPAAYRQRFFLEMEKFPYWHDDALDALSYVYDIIRDYRFGKRPVEESLAKFDKYRIEPEQKLGWMYQ
jgi:hypothetical protein